MTAASDLHSLAVFGDTFFKWIPFAHFCTLLQHCLQHKKSQRNKALKICITYHIKKVGTITATA